MSKYILLSDPSTHTFTRRKIVGSTTFTDIGKLMIEDNYKHVWFLQITIDLTTKAQRIYHLGKIMMEVDRSTLPNDLYNWNESNIPDIIKDGYSIELSYQASKMGNRNSAAWSRHRQGDKLYEVYICELDYADPDAAKAFEHLFDAPVQHIDNMTTGTIPITLEDGKIIYATNEEALDPAKHFATNWDILHRKSLKELGKDLSDKISSNLEYFKGSNSFNYSYATMLPLPEHSQRPKYLYPTDLCITKNKDSAFGTIVFIDGKYVNAIKYGEHLLIEDKANVWRECEYESMVFWDLRHLGKVDTIDLSKHDKTRIWFNLNTMNCVIDQLPDMDSKPLLVLAGRLYPYKKWYKLLDKNTISIDFTDITKEGMELLTADDRYHHRYTDYTQHPDGEQSGRATHFIEKLIQHPQSGLITLPAGVYMHTDTLVPSIRPNEYIQWADDYTHHNPLVLTECGNVIPYVQLRASDTTPQAGRRTYYIDPKAIRRGREFVEIMPNHIYNGYTSDKRVTKMYGSPDNTLTAITLYTYFEPDTWI